ncbi:Dps family protein [Bdellovibrio sp. NC01]|uniref:Dps family protein n=1 Tax=Bdellovibrio sp. NC01 TaxID=2220073 RepID=UPI00115A0478|nr:DNA starvation/stationary phase protection protein [Bdellovibrio sp. NC01]QDK36303.1 DNA starvation/stationary phase protection protein [Bdellovibrio sp. NC01]
MLDPKPTLQRYHENFLGLSSIERIRNADILSNLLSDSYFMLLKTQNCHWNVTGPTFKSLHQLFEEQYKELFKAIDEIAERIRGLGEYTPASFIDFSERSQIKERREHADYMDMLRDLGVSTQIMINRLRDFIRDIDTSEDSVTHDLLVRRLAVHEKNLWMIQSFTS